MKFPSDMVYIFHSKFGLKIFEIGAQKNCAIVRLIHVSNSHTKFGRISSNGFDGVSVTDRQTESMGIKILKHPLIVILHFGHSVWKKGYIQLIMY